MDITGEYTVPATRQEVWAALNDSEVLKACVPGCEEMERISDTELTMKITAKIGAIRAKLKGKLELSDIDAPNSYTISGSGQGGVAGFAKGGAKVQLADGPNGGTILSYEAQTELGGKLAAVGSRVIQGVAKKMADDFFGKLVKVVSGEVEKVAAPAAAVSTSPDSDLGISVSIPDWVKCAAANAIVSTIAIIVAVSMVSN